MRKYLILRQKIGHEVRGLRERRRWSQAELGRELGLSQSRLSQIERGQGSFTAEQFLRILEIFNVGVDDFVAPQVEVSEVQNALARLGARHLTEGERALPSERYDPTVVFGEVLARPESPRHLTALGPVFVAQGDRVSLAGVWPWLKDGHLARLGWLLESLRGALDRLPVATSTEERKRVGRARALIDVFLEGGGVRPPSDDAPFDLLDPNVRSPKTLDRLRKDASPEAKRWRVMTKLRTEDFVEAFEAAREAG